MNKIILLARVSTEEQKEAGNSLPAQMARLERYALEKGFEKKNIIPFEFDESAYKKEREKFNEVIEQIDQSKEPIALCCDKIDRLIRNFTSELVKLEEYRRTGKIELHFPSDNIVLNQDSPAHDLFRFTIGVSLAKYYSDSISDNVKRVQENKLRNGEWIGWAPVGYNNITLEDGKKWVEVNPFKSKIVISIFDWYSTGVYSMAQVKKKIKEEYDFYLSRSNVWDILKNPFYYGEMKFKGELYPHKYECLISKNTFDKAQEVKKSYKKKPFKYAGLPFYYRGVLRCAHCGCSITPERSKGYVYYHCTQYKGKHNAAWIREEKLTAEFGKMLKDIKLSDEAYNEVSEALKEAHDNKSYHQHNLKASLDNEYNKYQTRIEKMYEDNLDGRITNDIYDKKYREFREKQERIKRRIGSLEEADDSYYTTVTYLLRLLNKAPQLFERSKIEQRRELLQLILQNPQIKNDSLVYNLKKPFDTILQLSKTGRWLLGSDSNRQPAG